MPRRTSPEFLDDPDILPGELAALLSFLRTLNRRLGGVDSLLGHLRRWSVRWPRDRPITLLDVGTGSADLPVAVADWAAHAGFDLRVTAIDNHPGALEIAAGIVAGRDISLRRMSALDIGSEFPPAAFDYVHAGLMLHHLDDPSVLLVLKAMDRAARVGVIWNDLIRSARGRIATWLFTLPARPSIRHDARASVRAGFTREEAELLAGRADLGYCGYAANFNVQRFTIAGEKCTGWTDVAAPGGRP